MQSAMSPAEAVSVHRHLQGSLSSVRLDDELHLVYLLTPIKDTQVRRVLRANTQR
jgi:DNA polymerase Q-like protein